jgi:hypothetical protein
LDKDEEVEARPNKITQEEKMEAKKPQNLKRKTIKKDV